MVAWLEASSQNAWQPQQQAGGAETLAPALARRRCYREAGLTLRLSVQLMRTSAVCRVCLHAAPCTLTAYVVVSWLLRCGLALFTIDKSDVRVFFTRRWHATATNPALALSPAVPPLRRRLVHPHGGRCAPRVSSRQHRQGRPGRGAACCQTSNLPSGGPEHSQGLGTCPPRAQPISTQARRLVPGLPLPPSPRVATCVPPPPPPHPALRAGASP